MESLEQLKRSSSALQLYAKSLNLRKENKEFIAACPFHGEKTPSFKINQVDGKWLFHCFGCGASGSIIDFISRFDKISVSEAIKKIKDFNGESFEAKRKEVEQVFKPVGEKKPALQIPLSAYEKFEQALESSEAGQAWLKSRGIEMETARRLHTGFRQDVGKLAGTENADIADKGWIVFPCLKNGQVVSIKYRSIIRKSFTKQPGMQTALYNADSIDPLAAILITEGECDALVLEQAGFNAVSLPSASINLTPDMKSELHGASEIILAGDSDSAGESAMLRLWSELANHTYLLKWPESKDANEAFLKCKDLSAFRTLVNELTQKAKSEPIQHVRSVTEALLTSPVTASDDPRRLHFPWPSVDNMLVVKPGNIITVTASSTKTGKSTFILQTLVHGVRKHGEVALYYATESTFEQYFNMVASHLTQKERTLITREDREKAALLMGDGKLYIGQNPALNRVGPVLDFIEKAVQVLGATIVVLDHIHYICRNEPDTLKAQEDAMQRQVAMAKKYGLKYVVIGQPRKPSQERSRNKMVGIYEFKGSESFESDPDGIYILHRELKKGVDDPELATADPYEAETTVRAIGRELAGGNTTAKLYCVGKTATFTEMVFSPQEDKTLWETEHK